METNDKDKLIDDCIKKCYNHESYYRSVRQVPSEVKFFRDLVELLTELREYRKRGNRTVHQESGVIIENNEGTLVIK